MNRQFQPDALFATFSDLSPERLRADGVRLLFSDVDNTLAPYEEPDPSEEVKRWVASLKNAGIVLVLISNNHAPRLERFNQSLGLRVYPDSKKPLPRVFRRAAEEHGVPLAACAILGDQIFTDVWGARHLSMKAYMVPPIKDKTTLFFRAKRRMERPILRKFAKAHPDHIDLSFWKIKE